MGIAVSKIWRSLFGTKERKIVIVGLDNAGKTTILYSLHLGQTVATQPTIGGNVEEVTHNNLKFVMWDLGGQEALRSTWAMYYVNTDAVILVVDSADRDRVGTVREELHNILIHESLASAVILIYANKQDLPGAMTAKGLIDALELSRITSHAWQIQPCIATTGEGLMEGMNWIADQVKNR